MYEELVSEPVDQQRPGIKSSLRHEKGFLFAFFHNWLIDYCVISDAKESDTDHELINKSVCLLWVKNEDEFGVFVTWLSFQERI